MQAVTKIDPTKIPDPGAEVEKKESAKFSKRVEDYFKDNYPPAKSVRAVHLFDRGGISRFRVNWFREKNGELVIDSVFAHVREQDGKIEAEEQPS